MLEVQNLYKTFHRGSSRAVHAVRNVGFTLDQGRMVALIGESGSGKTTVGNMLLGLTAPSSGTVRHDGLDLAGFRSRQDWKAYYRKVQGVFQDPFSTFNPIFRTDRVFDLVRREFFPSEDQGAYQGRLETCLQAVGLNPQAVKGKYAHQLSGGQLQRLLIARALLLQAKVLVADEIISMLDASTRIDVLNLLGEMRDQGLSMVFVTHDLSLGYYIADRVIIMYKGVMVESGDTAQVFSNPVHPYSRSLLAAVPRLDMKWADFEHRLPPVEVKGLFDPDLDHGVPAQRQIGEDHWVAVGADDSTEGGRP